MTRSITLWFGALALAACGPARLPGGEVGSDAGTSSATTSSSTTGTGGAGSESESESESETGAGFFPQPDLPPPSCDILAQNCPEGEKCVPYHDQDVWGEEFKCVPVTGGQAPGDPCMSTGVLESTDDCDAGSFCWGYGEDLKGTCMEFCQGDVHGPDGLECPPSTQCQWYIFVCIPVCDPLAQDCPNRNTGCYWAAGRFECLPTAANIGLGDPCGYSNDCVPGLFCVDAGAVPDCAGAACCTSFCDLELGDLDCEGQPELSCVAFFREGTAPEGYENLGVCALP